MKSQDIKQNWLSFFSEKKEHLLVPSASLVPDNPTLLLTNAGMVPFVPYFLGQMNPPSSRITTVQRCIRLGGKDSDLENIGKTPRHLSFFEMLGNFSFGDYFKENTIQWAWELLTKVYCFPKEQLLVSVFAGDEKIGFDREAFEIWHKKIGLSSNQIIRLGRKDNFWGPPGGVSGPCGPCSEIYYLADTEAEPLEIWNLVFMQYEQMADGSLQTLQKPNVDTGAGLERLATILQKKDSVYQTDLLDPLLVALKLLPFDFNHLQAGRALKIMADHLRCSVMLLADGVRPSNLGRGYLLRMLIRRAARFGKLLGVQESFLHEVLVRPKVEVLWSNIFPKITENLREIQTQIHKEEMAFTETIERGLKKFQEVAEQSDHQIEGKQAFELYATYGFPLELTLDLASERGLRVDLESYQKAKEKHADLSNQNKFAIGFQTKENLASKIKSLNLPKTRFLGYISHQEHLQKIKTEPNAQLGTVLYSEIEVFNNQQEIRGLIVLDQTFFYAESGGQTSDQGILKACERKTEFKVIEVKNIDGVYFHTVTFSKDQAFLQKGDQVWGCYSASIRYEVAKHHTATHLLHAALRKQFGSSLQQKGSLVEAQRLRFDFSHSQPLSSVEIQSLNQEINAIVHSKYRVLTKEITYKQAIEQGALAFFEDKYGSQVRVLSIEDPVSSELYSLELCGGTHIENTEEIIGFKIIAESAISSGVRRLEAVSGLAYLEYLNKRDIELEEIKQVLKVPNNQLAEQVKVLQQNNVQKDQEIKNLSKQLLIYKACELEKNIQEIKGHKILLIETSISDLHQVLNLMGNRLKDNYLLFLVHKGASGLSYAAKVSKNLQKEFSAKDLITTFAQITKGNGGGNNGYAQGGSGKLEKLETGLLKLKEMLLKNP